MKWTRIKDQYALAGDGDWSNVRVIHEDTGLEVLLVQEVNCKEGWLIRFVDREVGDLWMGETETIRGCFYLEREM